jgi:microcystin-dependent protein
VDQHRQQLGTDAGRFRQSGFARRLAAADWTAHRRLVLPRTLGRALAIAGSGSGLTSRALGEYLGEETHTLTGPEMAHNHPITGTNRAQGPAGGVNTFNSPTGAVSNVTASPHNIINIMQPASFLNIMIKL